MRQFTVITLLLASCGSDPQHEGRYTAAEIVPASNGNPPFIVWSPTIEIDDDTIECGSKSYRGCSPIFLRSDLDAYEPVDPSAAWECEPDPDVDGCYLSTNGLPQCWWLVLPADNPLNDMGEDWVTHVRPECHEFAYDLKVGNGMTADLW